MPPEALPPTTETPPQAPTPTPAPAPTPSEGAPAPAPAPPAAPETYADFTAPQGQTLDPKTIEGARPIFKELGLSQDQAQKLVDFYTKTQTDGTAAQVKSVSDMRQSWRDQIAADPVMGGKQDQIKAEVGRALGRLDPKITTAFREAMDFTGAGDHPAFVRAFYDLAKLVNEGTHVPGGAPAPGGQAAPGTSTRPSLAESMYGPHPK